MKECGEVEVYIHSFMTTQMWGWVVISYVLQLPIERETAWAGYGSSCHLL